MSQPFSFDPKVIGQQLENWQKFWFGAFAPSQNNQGKGADEADLVKFWNNYMTEQAKFWQSAWASVAKATEGMAPEAPEGAENSIDWSNNPFFVNLKEMYSKSCEFIENQLKANSQHLSEEQQENLLYMTNQYLMALNPDNFLLTNPDALQEAYETQGKSLIQGMQNYWSDVEKGRISMSDDNEFEIGVNVCCTPGKVVLRNELIELLQYTPTTEKVYEKPLLVVPPCVNKYYLMDLAPQKSLVEYYVSQGYTVFLVSWKSATKEMKFFTWDTYVERGVITAINAVRSITKQDSINVLGFCVGGVLLSTALCVLKARGENYVDNVIFMTSMADHSEPGDIKYFVTEEFVSAREAKMDQGGIVSGLELQATFSALRPNDLIWNYVQDNYLKGKTPKPFDLLFWNNDSVDLPLPMHTFFLRHFYLNNELTKPGTMHVCGVPIDLGTIDIPIYFFAAERDHIVPWLSVYKGINLFTGAPERRFALGESGHIAGAINPASKNRRNYYTNPDYTLTPEKWRETAEQHPGSWWIDLNNWLSTRSGKKIPAPKVFGNNSFKPIADAPGEFVKATAIPTMVTYFM